MEVESEKKLDSATRALLPTTVEKVIPLQLDLGHLMAHDLTHDLDAAATGPQDAFEDILKSYTRDNVQILFNELFSLPTDTDDMGIFAKLPSTLLGLPRSKPIPPAQKPKTKWQLFAEKKGIKKVKRSALKYDETSGEYKPRHGAKSANNDPLKDWVVEDPN